MLYAKVRYWPTRPLSSALQDATWNNRKVLRLAASDPKQSFVELENNLLDLQLSTGAQLVLAQSTPVFYWV
jgi:hypothetical protein